DDDSSRADALNESKALGMTDLTILYPLPKNMDGFDDLLRPTSELDRGELLPAELFASLAEIAAPPMMDSHGRPVDPKKPLFANWANEFSRLRVVGVRFDPCFAQTANLNATNCENQIRLTAQFFQHGGNLGDEGVFPDPTVGIHLFYTITRAE